MKLHVIDVPQNYTLQFKNEQQVAKKTTGHKMSCHIVYNHMACLTNLTISAILYPLINNEAASSQRSVWCDKFLVGFFRF
jgi:hypothetical protein